MSSVYACYWVKLRAGILLTNHGIIVQSAAAWKRHTKVEKTDRHAFMAAYALS